MATTDELILRAQESTARDIEAREARWAAEKARFRQADQESRNRYQRFVDREINQLYGLALEVRVDSQGRFQLFNGDHGLNGTWRSPKVFSGQLSFMSEILFAARCAARSRV